MKIWCSSVLTLAVCYTTVKDYQSCNNVKMAGVSGIKQPDHHRTQTTPVKDTKTKTQLQKPTPFRGNLKANLKTEERKINKIFQLKRRKRKKFLGCPHQCQVAILEECPKRNEAFFLCLRCCPRSQWQSSWSQGQAGLWSHMAAKGGGGSQSSPAP